MKSTPEKMKLGKRTFTITPITLEDMPLADLLGDDGSLDQARLLEASVTEGDGKPVAYNSLPIGLGIRLTNAAMRVCGFIDDDDDEGTDPAEKT